jgi:hypothetical protein
MLIAAKPAGVVLRLKYPGGSLYAVDHEMVDLSVFSVHSDAKIMEDRRSLAASEFALQEVSSVTFASYPAVYILNQLLNGRAEACGCDTLEQLELRDAGRAIVASLGSYKPLLTADMGSSAVGRGSL